MFPYIGGKSFHVKWMDEFFPSDFDMFVDVFGGAGWVSVKSKKILGSANVYNDFNPLLSNVFECFRTDPERVLSEMDKLPGSDADLYKQFQKELLVDLNLEKCPFGDFELAAKLLYLQTQMFSGTKLTHDSTLYFADVKSQGKYSSKYETLKRKLRNEKVVDRLKQIYKVENMDCVEVIKKYDDKSTFFYLDPPYFKTEFYYSKDFPREKHEELAATLANIKGRFALSYYDFEGLELLYPKDTYTWHCQSVYKSSATRSSKDPDYKKISNGEEILIMNY